MSSEPIPKDVADYLKRGWPVVPVHVTRTEEGKDVVFLTEHSFNDASADYDVVADWAIRYPDCGWAIATGPESFFAVDVDKAGIEAWEALTKKNGSVKTMAVRTPGGGYHFYYAWPEGVETIKSSAGQVAPGVDVRGTGGCVFAPPTPGYSLVNGEPNPADATWLVGALTSPTEPQDPHHVRVEQAPDQTIPKGRRNTSLAALAGAMRRQGAGIEAIAAALAFENAARCDPPLLVEEVDSIAGSIARYEPASETEIQNWVGQDLDLSQVRERPEERLQLIEGFLDTERLTMLFGKPGHFKSFLAMDAAVAVASGRRWLSATGMDGMLTMQSPVVFIQQDQGARDTTDRFHALYNAYDVPPTIPLHVYAFPRPALDLLRNYDFLAEAVRRHEAKFVVVDNLFNAAGVRDENSSEIGLAIMHLAELRDQTGAAILLIHHPTKGTGWSRGHGVILQNVDQSLKLIRDEEYVRFETEKERGAGITDRLVARFDYEYYEASRMMRSARFVRSSADAIEEKEFEEAYERLLEYVADNPGEPKKQVYAGTQLQRTMAAKAVAKLVLSGRLEVVAGPRGAQHLYMPGEAP